MIAVGRYPETTDTDTDADGGGKAHTSPDYSAVNLPAKAPTEYTYVERRAAILQQVHDLGTPDALNQSELADRYGVSQTTISRDLDRLGEHVRDAIGDRDRRALVVDSVIRRSIRGLLDDDEYHKAASVALDYNEWLTEFHDLDALEQRLADLERETDLSDGGGW